MQQQEKKPFENYSYKRAFAFISIPGLLFSVVVPFFSEGDMVFQDSFSVLAITWAVLFSALCIWPFLFSRNSSLRLPEIEIPITISGVLFFAALQSAILMAVLSPSMANAAVVHTMKGLQCFLAWMTLWPVLVLVSAVLWVESWHELYQKVEGNPLDDPR